MNNSYLLNMTNEEIKTIDFFNLNDKELYARCVEVYDGDTITIITFIFEKLYKFKVRLIYINTPEIHTKDEEEKIGGLKARDFLKKMILDKIVFIKCHNFDAFGRLLAEVYYNNQNINELLIDEKYAVEFMKDGAE